MSVRGSCCYVDTIYTWPLFRGYNLTFFMQFTFDQSFHCSLRLTLTRKSSSSSCSPLRTDQCCFPFSKVFTDFTDFNREALGYQKCSFLNIVQTAFRPAHGLGGHGWQGGQRANGPMPVRPAARRWPGDRVGRRQPFKNWWLPFNTDLQTYYRQTVSNV